MQKKLAYIASRLRAYDQTSMQTNVERAVLYERWAYGSGYNPFTPHLAYARFLDDTVSEERDDAMAMGLAMLERMDTMLVFTYDEISSGMHGEIIHAAKCGIKPQYIPKEIVQMIAHGMNPKRRND